MSDTAPSTREAGPVVRAGLARGRALMNRGEFWAAHEALEGAWHAADGPDREGLQGLIQAAAAFHKYVVQDNPRGARELLRRAIEKLERASMASIPLALDALCAELRAWRARLETRPSERGLVRGVPRFEWAPEARDQLLVVERVDLYRLERGTRRAVLVGVSAQGLTGWGECRHPWGRHGLMASLADGLAPALLSEPIGAPSELPVAWRGVAADPYARAGLEAAVWDLWARRLERPFHAVLGHSPRAVTLAGIVRDSEPQRIAARAEALRDAGFRELLLPARPNSDRRVLPEIVEGLDAGFAFSLGGAYRMAHVKALQVLASLGPRFLANPVPAERWHDLARLRRWLAHPISARVLPDAEAAEGAMELAALDVLEVEPGRVGPSESCLLLDAAAREGHGAWLRSEALTAVGRHGDLALACHPAADRPMAVNVAGEDEPPSEHSAELLTTAEGSARPEVADGIGFAPAAGWLRAEAVEHRGIQA